MDLKLKKKSVIVMAASGGIGKATALEFAREGAGVMMFARSEERLRQAQEDIEVLFYLLFLSLFLPVLVKTMGYEVPRAPG